MTSPVMMMSLRAEFLTDGEEFQSETEQRVKAQLAAPESLRLTKVTVPPVRGDPREVRILTRAVVLLTPCCCASLADYCSGHKSAVKRFLRQANQRFISKIRPRL